ncbi:hypothetical protein LJR296_007691 [Cupriavidus necator]|uniref:SLOG domain-containing protein n=1 Tax=Cupriavidus necator TaxID=106590 RepID=UPI003ED0C0B2
MGAIFLSASIPTPGRAPFDQDIEPMAIQAAVSALASVVIGRRILVWGGHPAITPMLWASARDMGISYGNAVHLFQSAFWSSEDFPEENRHFGNVTYVPPVDGDRDKSLLAMREAMLTSADFEAAVFIGGMEGIFDEHTMFSTLHPHATCLPLAVTGGAARQLCERLHYAAPQDIGPLDFISLFYRELHISPLQRRDL